MINIDQFRTIAMQMPGVTEAPHFEKTSFRFRTKIFATVDRAGQTGCLKLSGEEQRHYSLSNTAVSPVPNKWGNTGWTNVDLAKVTEPAIADLIRSAYKGIKK
jgi:hypothetical protein